MRDECVLINLSCPHRAERFKTSLQFVPLPYKRLYATLDGCKVADYVIFVLSSEVEVDGWGDTLLRALQAQGLPQVITVVGSPTPMEAKAKPGIVKSLLSFIQYFVPSQTRVFDLHVGADRLNTLRAVCEGKPEDVKWREGRPYVLAENVQWADGVLAVTGVVRGASLSADRLVHLPNYGDFQIQKVRCNNDPIVMQLLMCTVNISRRSCPRHYRNTQNPGT